MVCFEFLQEKPWIAVISGMLFLLVLVMFTRAVLADPGFVMNKGNLLSLDKVLQENPVRSTFFQAKFVLNTSRGRLQRLKYCRTCLILRPPRVSHCSLCGYCVEKYDHHCPWLGNCIGKNNYKQFLWFLLLTFTLILFDFAVGVEILKENAESHSLEETLNEFGGVFFICLYTGTVRTNQVFFFVTSLLGFHCYLVWIDTTTHEFFSKSWTKPKYNPYNSGCFRNFYKVFRNRRDLWILGFEIKGEVEVVPEILANSNYGLEEKGNSVNTTALNKLS